MWWSDAWASPASLEEGGQDRARGHHLTAAKTLSAFGRFNQCGGGGGGFVRFRPIQPVGRWGGGVWCDVRVYNVVV